MKVSFVYAGRRGSALECTLALHSLAKRMGHESEIILSQDNERASLVRKLYKEASFASFFSPSQFSSLRRRLQGRAAVFTMVSPKMAPLFHSLRSPKAFYFHATYDYTYSTRTLRDAFHEMLHDSLIRASTATVATQPGLAMQIRQRLGVDAGVLPHPPYSLIKPDFFSGERKVALPFAKGSYFLNFGEISRPSKGTGLLMGAAFHTPIPLVLCGRREGVMARENIFHLNRYVQDDELYYLVKNCRCVALPYLLRSQFSGCLALAFHFRKPVLAPDTEAFEGWVEEGRTGWLFAHADRGSLQSRMRQIAAGKAKFSQKAIAAKEKEREVKTAQALASLLRLLSRQ